MNRRPTRCYANPYALILVVCLNFVSCGNDRNQQPIVSSDISNFWEAYDQVQTTQDTIEQQNYLQTLFLDKASPGQQRMIAARNYTVGEYLDVIKKYPNFWKSLRPNTMNIDQHNKEIHEGVKKLKEWYPSLKESTVYYTMGAFRSPGTGIDSLVLIGSEFALGDTGMDTKEFVGDKDHIVTYHQIDPLKHLQSLTIHEYVHSQQNQPVYNLLSQCLYEGVGELIGTELAEEPSPWTAFEYGPKNEKFVQETFEKQLFDNRNMGDWLWNDTNNPFGTRDMGYYVGYRIARLHFDKATDKKQAIKELIELDYEDEDAVEQLVNGTGYFSKSLEELYTTYENDRPKVMGIKQFENGGLEVDTATKVVTIQFSEPMDPDHRGFDFGPLGKDYAMIMTKYLGFSEDRTEVSFEVSLQPGRKYQLQLPSKFMDASGYFNKPYLIEFETKK